MSYSIRMKAKLIDIEAGKYISVIHECDAKELGVLQLDRLELTNPETKESVVTIADTTDTVIKPKEIGIFEDVRKKLELKEGEEIEVRAVPQPESVRFIKNKMDKKILANGEIKEIVRDLAENKLSEIEATAFVTAIYINGFTLGETVSMTRALIEDGQRLRLERGPVADKHSIGGINGRTTMIIVPIIASSGLYIPKTSSRAITSAAGTADSMEVLANVCFSLEEIKRITEKVGGAIAWGGSLDLAPVDDKIIKIEHPLSLDPEGQVIASVMAKKGSVGAEFLVIDIPIGPEMKVRTKEKGEEMAKKFLAVGNKIGIKVEVVLTDGTKPLGKSFGAALEAKEIMEILEGKYFNELGDKSCELAGILLELAGRERKGKGKQKAIEVLKSGQALEKMKEIIKAQEGKIFSSEQIKTGKFKEKIYSEKEGEIKYIKIGVIKDIARIAGAPNDKGAGVFLRVEVGEKIKKMQPLFEIYAENGEKMELAKRFAQQNTAIETEEMVLEKIC